MEVWDQFLRTDLHTKSNSLQKFLLIAYLKSSGQNGSKKLHANGELPHYPVSEDK